MEDPDDCTTTASVEHPLSSPSKGFSRDDLLKLPQEFRNILAGGIAGMAAKSVVAPIDRIKILYQISSAKFQLDHVPRVAYNIIQNEGVSALWKGNMATMIRVFPYSGIQFMVFDRCKTYLLRQHADRIRAGEGEVDRQWGLSSIESLLAGSVAGLVSVAATYPLDLTRAQLAVLRKHRHHKNMGFVRVLMQNYEHRGPFGLFRGITPTMLGIVPYSGAAYALNEQGKRKIHNVLGRAPTTMEKMQCGAVSGLFAQTLTYPLEVTRRRMQTIGIVPTSGKDAAVNALGIADSSYHAEKPVSMVKTLRLLYQEQGLRGMYKGVSMNWMKGPVAFSISFTAFDIMQGLLATDEERRLRNPHH